MSREAQPSAVFPERKSAEISPLFAPRGPDADRWKLYLHAGESVEVATFADGEAATEGFLGAHNGPKAAVLWHDGRERFVYGMRFATDALVDHARLADDIERQTSFRDDASSPVRGDDGGGMSVFFVSSPAGKPATVELVAAATAFCRRNLDRLDKLHFPPALKLATAISESGRVSASAMAKIVELPVAPPRAVGCGDLHAWLTLARRRRGPCIFVNDDPAGIAAFARADVSELAEMTAIRPFVTIRPQRPRGPGVHPCARASSFLYASTDGVASLARVVDRDAGIDDPYAATESACRNAVDDLMVSDDREPPRTASNDDASAAATPH